MTDEVNARFTTGNMLHHVSVTSLTASVGLMAIYAVDLIDLLFISALGYEALAAAAGYASALIFFASAINIGLSIAAGVLVSRTVGARKKKLARELATSTLMFVLLTGFAIPIFSLPNVSFLLSLLGATGDIADLAASYLRIILPFTFISGLSMVAVAVLRGYGENRVAMYPSLMGALTNATLDPIMIFALGMGLNGAAWATVVARIVTFGFAMYPAMRIHNAFVAPKSAWFFRDLGRVSRLAFPAVLANVATPIGTAIVTREISKFGAEAVAGMAVIGRIVPVAFSVVLALSGAIAPIMGQNFGAGLIDRVEEAFFDGLKFVFVYVLLITGLLFVFREAIADSFGAENLSRSLILLFCFPLALSSFFNGSIFVSGALFNTLGRPSYATLLNWGQNTLGTWPCVVMGGWIWNAPGVLIGQAFGSIIFSLIAIWLSLRIIRHPPTLRKMPRNHRNRFGYQNLVMHILQKHGGAG